MKVHLSKKKKKNLCFWKSLSMLLHKFLLLKQPFMTWTFLHSLKGARSSVLQLPCAEWRGKARPLWVPISASLKSFQSTSGGIPFSAKYTERCFTRGKLKSCWGRKCPKALSGTDRNTQKKFPPSLKLSASAYYTVSSSGAIAKVSVSSREGRRYQSGNSVMQSMGFIWKTLDSLQTTPEAVSQELEFGSQDSSGQRFKGLIRYVAPRIVFSCN